MKYYLGICFALILVSCQTDQDSLAFNIPTDQAEIAEVNFSATSATSTFYYRILAEQLIINWGDGNRPVEYVDFSNPPNWSLIHPIEHKYTKEDNFLINIRTKNPFLFDFSKPDSLASETSITKLTLTNCQSLSELYCRNQPLELLDVSSCNNLTTLDIGSTAISDLQLPTKNRLEQLYIDSSLINSIDVQYLSFLQTLSIGCVNVSQKVTGIDSLKHLKKLEVRGLVETASFEALSNDSLQVFEAIGTNLSSICFDETNALESISFTNCNQLSVIKLISNTNLRNITLIKNLNLRAEALNAIFESLPESGGINRSIYLSENQGDETCDRSIALKKGWIFKQ